MFIIACSSFHPLLFHYNLWSHVFLLIIHMSYLTFMACCSPATLLSSLSDPSLSLPAWLFRLYGLHLVVGIFLSIYPALIMILWFRPTFAIAHKSFSPEGFTDILSSMEPNLNQLFSYSPHSIIYRLLFFIFYLVTNSTIYIANWIGNSDVPLDFSSTLSSLHLISHKILLTFYIDICHLPPSSPSPFYFSSL